MLFIPIRSSCFMSMHVVAMFIHIPLVYCIASRYLITCISLLCVLLSVDFDLMQEDNARTRLVPYWLLALCDESEFAPVDKFGQREQKRPKRLPRFMRCLPRLLAAVVC